MITKMDWIVFGSQRDNKEDNYKCIVFGSLILALDDHHMIYFGCQKNNKEDGLQMDSIWISDVIYPKTIYLLSTTV